MSIDYIELTASKLVCLKQPDKNSGGLTVVVPVAWFIVPLLSVVPVKLPGHDWNSLGIYYYKK